MRWVLPLTISLALIPGALRAAPIDSPTLDQLVAQGRSVYEQQHCQRCHAIAGVGNRLRPLDAIADKYDATEIRRRITAEGPLREALSGRAQAAKRRNAALPPQQLDALVAYLLSLRAR